MEKYILRKAFDDPEDPYLPESVLWRQKEQFSDGVGYDWVDGLKEHAQKASLSIEVCRIPAGYEQRAQLTSSATPASGKRCRVWLQVVTDEMWAARASRFPEHTPSTREYYLLRSIFEEHYPSRQALLTVPTVSALIPVLVSESQLT